MSIKSFSHGRRTFHEAARHFAQRLREIKFSVLANLAEARSGLARGQHADGPASGPRRGDARPSDHQFRRLEQHEQEFYAFLKQERRSPESEHAPRCAGPR